MTFWIFILFLSIVIFQDFKERKVYWWAFPGLLISAYFSFNIVSTDALLSNFLFVATQLLGITIYIRFREKRWVWMGDKYLGLGDILFFLIPLILFAPINFVLFFMISLFIGILVYTFIKVSLNKNITIPLAGLQALMLIVYLACIHLKIAPQFDNDTWLLR